MQLTSPDFVSGEEIPRRSTCDGENINPILEIGGVPEGAGSLALVVEDPQNYPDTFIHWIVCNISCKTQKIKSGILPNKSIEGLNSLGIRGYTGPCPKAGTHNYIFTLYAIDITLNNFDQNKISHEILFEEMTGHILETAELIGIYKKNK